MKAAELKRRYLAFFEKKRHAVIASASLIPEHDPTVLFTTEGMHPLVPFLMGQPHPEGRRLADVQKCIRTGDIDEVGDATHLTFFEMLGNWSLGDYFKKEAISFSFEFLTEELGIPLERLGITVFAGDDDAPRDEESAGIWKSLGIPASRISYRPKKDNWWGPAGATGPCGPDTEMFYWSSGDSAPEAFDPDDARWVEIWNDVFMQYNKKEDATYEPLSQKNVDTGMGVERTAAMLQGKKSIYDTEALARIAAKVRELATLSGEESVKSERVITDHLRAAVFILGDEHRVTPSNLDQGYVLRRFIRRAIRHGHCLGIEGNFTAAVAKDIIDAYREEWPEVGMNEAFILDELQREEARFLQTLQNGLRRFEEMATKDLSGDEAFLLFQSYGFPIEMVVELAKEKGISVDRRGFDHAFALHQERSRVGAEKRFKGGLADASDESRKLHTATHLLNQALRNVLKDDSIRQMGSNITPERLRFDFNFARKLEKAELQAVEDEVNANIARDLPVRVKEMTVEEAKGAGAQGVFEHKYGERVFVYFIGDYSVEICGGPHVSSTQELGRLKIRKEESISAGVRRIKAVLVER